jgi:isohexenylglutaconyl-CoA hydratase
MQLPEVTSLQLRFERGVLHVTLNRPESRNAMTRQMVTELEAVAAAVTANSVRAVVLRGAGGHFCAGADLKEVMTGGIKPPAAGEADPIEAVSRSFGTMLRKMSQTPAVIIAICDGSVLGGGFGLACISDIAFAHVDAKFGLPETSRGLPPAQIAPFVVERIGLTQARKLCLTGAQFRGSEALRLGLVHDTFASEDELKTKLDEALKQVLGCAPQANAMTKEIILKVAREDMDRVLDDAAKKFAAAARGAEAPEGIMAFMQKRAPKWAQ